MSPSVPWSEFESSEPGLAGRVAARFLCHPHHVLAVLAPDGRPRVWGSNIYLSGGELWFGAMPGALRTDDLRRDGRVAVHSAPLSEELDGGDAKIEGIARVLGAASSAAWMERHLARPQGEEPPQGDVSLVSLCRVVLTEVGQAGLVVTTWEPDRGVRIVQRA